MKYCGTPPEHLLFAQRAALDILKEEGLEAACARHATLARATQAAVSVWSGGGAFDFNVVKADQRCQSVTTVLATDEAMPVRLRAFCREELGVVLGLGIGPAGDRQFRIAHMGHCNAPATLGVLGCIEAALAALSIPHETGGATAAAAEIAAAFKG